MSTSLAMLNSRVFLSLEAASEYLKLDQVHNAVVQALNIRTIESRNSATDVLIALTPEFTPDSTHYNITSLIGNATPSWLESQWNIIDSINEWHPVRVVPLVQLSDYRNMGVFACSFYAEESNSPTDAAVSWVDFSFLPAKACRIRFTRNITRLELTAYSLLPDELSELVVLEAQNRLISRIKLSLAMRLRRDEAGRTDSAMIMNALSELYAQNAMDIRRLDATWRVWAFRSPDSDSAFNNVTPSNRGLYGDRSNRAGYGGYGSGI